MMHPDKLRNLALDLNETAPRSPYAPLGASFPAVAARLVDKCRAELLAGRARTITIVRWIASFSLPPVSSRRRCVTLFPRAPTMLRWRVGCVHIAKRRRGR